MRGESEMDKIIVNIKSITHAHKAQKILKSNGIPSNLKKSTTPDGTSGCGYSLYIDNKFDNAVSLLEKYKIPIASVRNGGVVK